MVEVVKSPLDVGIDHPLFPTIGAGQYVDLADGIVAASARSEPITTAFELRLPVWFPSILDHRLKGSVHDGRDPQGSLFAVGLGNVHTSDRLDPPRLEGGHMVHQLSASSRGLDDHLVHARRVLPCIDLRNPPHGHQDVGVATQHELLERTDLA